MDTQNDEVLSFSAAARFLGIDRPALRLLVRQGEISGHRTPWRWRFRVSDLRAYAQRIAAQAPPTSMMGDIGRMIAEMGPPPKKDPEGLMPAETAPIVRMVNAIIVQAVSSGASDIHIEPDRRGVRVRYRIDGVLNEAMTIPKHIQPALISRFKTIANMSVTEGRIHSEGRIPIRYEGKDYTLRVSSVSSLYGESVVARILNETSALVGLSQLGFTPDVQAQLEELVSQPGSLVLVTGPLGSGKTTTLCSLMHRIASTGKKTFSVEEIIEYRLEGTIQVGVAGKAGGDVADAVRAVMRQDPDVLMIGDLRDGAAARAACEAAVAGPLVLASLHAPNAVSAITRLIPLGVEPPVIAQSVTGILAQRLVRRICTNCREPYRVNAEALRQFGFIPEDTDQQATLYRGRGCETCRNSGYRGRISVHELIRVNEEVAELIERRAPRADIIDAACANGMRVMYEDGFMKVLEGITTPEELARVLNLRET